MKKIFFLLSMLTLVMPTHASACAIAPFEPEGTRVVPSGLSQALIVWNEGKETLVLDPQLKGDAQDFGLAFAFPSRPEVEEGSREIFSELSEYTKPKVVYREKESTPSFGAGAIAPETSAAPEVTVIEEKEVGEFTVAVLQATKASALGEWLKSNGYHYTANDEGNFDYYVQKGGHFFVALKMIAPESLDDVSEYARGNYAFKPIAFAFQVQTPLFPSRLAKDNDPVQQFRIYTLSKTALMIPGAATPFAKQVDPKEAGDDLPALSPYLGDTAPWLVKLDMKIDPSKIEQDLKLSAWNNPEEFHMTTEENPQLLFPDQRQQGGGIVLASAEDLRFDGPIAEKPVFTDIVLPEPPLPWYEQNWFYGLLFLGIILALHVYIAAALLSLARRFGIRHRWRAWVPIANLSLLVNLGGRRWQWFLSILIIPFLIAFVYTLSFTVSSNSAIIDTPNFYYTVSDFLPLVGVVLLFLEYTLLERVCTALVIRCGRPSWWGPLMVLIPPIGLILLGVLAWSKKSYGKSYD